MFGVRLLLVFLSFCCFYFVYMHILALFYLSACSRLRCLLFTYYCWQLLLDAECVTFLTPADFQVVILVFLGGTVALIIASFPMLIEILKC